MKESVAIAKEADAKKEFSSTKSDKSIHRVQHESERQLGSLRSVIDSIRRNGGTPSVDSIATELSGMPTVQRASALLALQQTHGNRYVQRVVRGIQAKLKIGQPGDIYEQEADRVADEVMRMSGPEVQREPEGEEEKLPPQVKIITPIQALTLQRQDDEEEEEFKKKKKEEEEEEYLQAKNTTGKTPEVTPDIEFRIQSLKGDGQPLPGSVRTFFEPRFGYDFSLVRVHTDAQAAESARTLSARALTVGHDVVFGAGQYAPETTAGQRLLAHELTHVVQQSVSKPLTEQLLIQQKQMEPKTNVGPTSGQGGLIHDTSRKRLSVIIGPNDTLRSIAKKLLSLWTTATPFTPKGESAPLPLTPLTEEQLAKGLLVYNRYYLAVPHMTNWKVGLRFPLPIEVNQVTAERTLHPDLIATWANSFDPKWNPLLDLNPAATAAPSVAELEDSVKSFLKTSPMPMVRGIHLSARAMTNTPEAEPFIKEVFRQLGSDAFDTAVAFMDNLVVHQFEMLASQRAGLDIINTIHAALSKAPAILTSEQQASLERANRMLEKLGVFSKETAESFKQIYIKDVPGCNCMTAVYKGMEALFSKEVSKSISTQVTRDAKAVMKRTGRDTNHMDRIMETVRSRGKAGPMIELNYNKKNKNWEPDPEKTILGKTHPTVAGWYFFGLSLHGAFHSVILAVDKTDPSNPQIYWMDQFSRGFANNVTGKLPEEMESFEPSYGFAPSKIWQIMPAADTLIALK
jgi:hypothetical protein